MDSSVKAEIKQEYQQHEKDTGSVEVQVALLSKRIQSLTAHLQSHKGDHNSRRGLIVMVSKRRRLLDYLRDREFTRYQTLIGRRGLRRLFARGNFSPRCLTGEPTFPRPLAVRVSMDGPSHPLPLSLRRAATRRVGRHRARMPLSVRQRRMK